MRNHLVSIIIVNWNGLPDLKECLESLKNIIYKNIEIIISDNGSRDGSVEYIKNLQQKQKRVILIENGKNLGFAQGNNVAIPKAKGDLILFLNNDTIVDKNFLMPLISQLTLSKAVAGVQPKILCYPRTTIIDSIGSYFLHTGFLYHYGHNKPDQEKYHRRSEIFSMKGACMLFKKSVLDTVGVFDSKYFAYFEETDLCHRAWLAGYKIIYVPNSIVYHKGGQTAKHLPSAFVEYHSNKNRLYTYLKNFEFTYLIKVIPLHMLFLEISACVYLFLLRFSLFIAIQKAILWNASNIQMLRADRKAMQKIRKITDNEYLPRLTKKVRFNYYYHLLATALAGYKD